MLSIKATFCILRSKSFRYILFRTHYEFERRMGLLERKYPTKTAEVQLPTLSEWRSSSTQYLFDGRRDVDVVKKATDMMEDAANRVLQGEVRFYSHEWKSLGLNWNYVTNPINRYQYDMTQHWTKVADYNEKAGDIKFVWEPSRFSSLYTIIRFDYHTCKDHAEFVINRILDWVDKNPLNCGPNYKCSQEISLRVLNWLFALYFYKDSEALTEERWQKIIHSIYWQVNHVYNNINFSRISVRNNHAITETLTLYLIGLLFPQMPGATSWKKDGKRWFEQEIEYQFEPDGSYLQQSMNYQRVVTQLLTLGISLAEKNGERFRGVVYQRAYANLNFLYQMQDEKSGRLPNYGANDGALFFPLNDMDYRDYRPQLDALHSLLTGEPLYNSSQEDTEWYGIKIEEQRRFKPLRHKQGATIFKDGGYFIVRNKDKMVFIRCGGFKGVVTPDQMHIDLWSKGENVLMDGGSYMYNTDEKTITYFSGSESENTLMLSENGQMKKGPRFMWFYPSRIIKGELKETDDGYLFEGCVETFRSIKDGIIWNRIVRIDKDIKELSVTDILKNKPKDLVMRQLWHTTSKAIIFVSDGAKEEKKGWYSDYYGTKEENKQLEYWAKGDRITTKITIS